MEIRDGPFTAFLPDNVRSDAPLVIVMGWAGAQDRALGKYISLLASNGLPTVRSVQPVSNIFSPLERPRRLWAEALILFISRQAELRNRPFILYAFSNGGGFVVEQIHKFISQDRLPSAKFLGVIFDSAPGYMHPGLGVKVIAESNPPGIKRTLMSITFNAMLGLTPYLYGDRKTLYWGNMRDLNLGPALYLFSMDDPLCDGEKLKSLLAEKEALGQDITWKCWEESEHCGHLKCHTQEYVEFLLDFLRDKLKAIPEEQSRAASAVRIKSKL